MLDNNSKLDILLLYPPGANLDYQMSLPCLAAYLLEKGFKVKIKTQFPCIFRVSGGVHATLVPEEIAPHCDAVVIGDGEEII